MDIVGLILIGYWAYAAYKKDAEPMIWTDPETGVQYVSTVFGFAMHVRLNQDGKPVLVPPTK